jgi:predicted enzyme related to lactoylglutathione lyase
MFNSHGRFVWYELITPDMEAAAAFYVKVMGWSTRGASAPSAAYTLFTIGGTSVAGLTKLPENARKMGAEPRWIGYVSADNVDATVDRITQLGGAVHAPPTDIPNVSRFSVVADPQMATLVLVKWRGPHQQQAAEPGELGHVGWHELLAADWENVFGFYREIFGWQKAAADIGPMGTYQLFSAGGQTIGGMFNKPPTAPVAFWLYYFNIGDVDAAGERVKVGGGQILEGPTEVPGGGKVARCTDPQGAMFALIGERSKAIGYFERGASRDSDARTRRWSW